MTLSRSRYRSAALSAMFGAGERGVLLLAAVLRVPLLIRALGVSQYGVWVATLGIVQAASFLNLGLQYGVINFIASSRAADDLVRLRRVVATAFTIYSVIVMAAIAASIPIVIAIPMKRLLGIHELSEHTVTAVVIVCLFDLLLVMPLNVFSVALTGLQRQYVLSVRKSITALVQLGVLAGVFVFGHLNILGWALVVLALDLASAIWLALWSLKRFPEIRFLPRDTDRSLVRPLLSVGMLFLISDVGNAFRLTYPAVVVSHYSGPASVPGFALTQQLFQTAWSLTLFAVLPFWPAYADAAARSDWGWIDRAFRRTTSLAFLCAGAFAVLGAALGRDVIHLWSSRAVDSGLLQPAVFAVWLMAEVLGTCVNTLLCGLSRNRESTYVILAGGAITLAAATIGAYWFGREGVAVAVAATSFAFSYIFLPRLIRRATGGRVLFPSRTALLYGVVIVTVGAAGILGAHAMQHAKTLVRVAVVAPAVFLAYAIAARALLMRDDDLRELVLKIAQRFDRWIPSGLVGRILLKRSPDACAVLPES